ncbi:putative RNA methyltransferase At5g10620 [Iris pallida]|uniref:RNA methyltransferase At5g10620 n=1 Tax=Iris pallida TaxID=29817 RepID=A0AAX6EZS9_IRIPA|nr:putative RNA methyltransferase At5g10620 [Iris pallida]
MLRQSPHSNCVFSCLKKNGGPLFERERESVPCKYSAQSIRAIPIRIVTVGKKRGAGIQLLVEEYKDKIQHYCTIDDLLIKSNPKNTSNVQAQIEAEDMGVFQQLRSEDWVVVLDEHGTDLRSEQMANLVGDAGRTGSSRLLFCIGGPYGHGPQVRRRANMTIKLSSMVLNHQIALVVLLEQLYRAWTIIKGQKYHH